MSKLLMALLLVWLVALSSEQLTLSSEKLPTTEQHTLNPCMKVDLDEEVIPDVYRDTQEGTTPSIYDLTNPEDNVWI